MANFYQITDVGLKDFAPLFTEEALRQFKTDPDVMAVGAGERGQACAVMLVKFSEYLLHILYLYVSEDFRECGIATGLLNLAQDMAFKNEKPLIANFYAESNKDPLYCLFNYSTAFTLEETVDKVYRVPVDVLKSARDHVHSKKDVCTIMPFSELTDKEKDSFYQKCSEKGEAYFDPNASNYLPPMCLAAKIKGEVKAAFLATTGDDEICLRYLYSENPAALREIIRAAADRADRLPKEIKYMRIATVNEESRNLIDHVLKDAEVVGTFYLATMDFSV